MDRKIVYPSAIPLDVDILQPQQDAMVAVGYALQASYGGNTVFVGLACAPTAPSSMSVTVGPGAVISANVVETTPFGSLLADTTDPLIKMGINTTSNTFTLTAPTTAGQSQNYLIQCSFSEADDTPATLVYFNSLNPTQPYSGPSNSGTPQNTRRAQRANLQIKVGVPANTGTQITPPVDSGWNGLYIITVAYGQTSITGTSISTYPSAPFLAAFLSSHHGGVPGQAPQINLASEVQGILPTANLPPAVGFNLVYAGNPNGYVAGTAAIGSSPPSMCWDTVHDEWWTCVTTGSTTTAFWSSVQNSKNSQLFTGSGTYVVPPGVTVVKATVVGGGGGGGGIGAVSTTTMAAAPGGNGGCLGVGYYNVSPGQNITVTIGTGGAGGAAGGTAYGTNGGASSFGTYLSAPGGAGASGMSTPITGTVNISFTLAPVASTLTPSGALVGVAETQGGAPLGNGIGNIISGGGGTGIYGGSGGSPVIGSNTAAVGAAGKTAGGGGSGAAGGGVAGAAKAGGAGAAGIVLVEW